MTPASMSLPGNPVQPPEGHRLIVMCPSCGWWFSMAMLPRQCLRCGTPPRRIWAWISCQVDGCFTEQQFDEWVDCSQHGASTVLVLELGVGWL